MGVWEKVKVRPAGTGAVGRAGVAPKRDVREFRVRGGEGLLGVGETVGAEWFSVGQWVDAKSHCRGMGFAGVSGCFSCLVLDGLLWEMRGMTADGVCAFFGRLGHETLGIQRSGGVAWCFPDA